MFTPRTMKYESIVHCKELIPKIVNEYSQKRKCAASVPIYTFVCLWSIYIFPWSICLFCCRKYVDRSWDNINRSQTHECGNWDWGRAILRKGTHIWDFRCSVKRTRLFDACGIAPPPPHNPPIFIAWRYWLPPFLLYLNLSSLSVWQEEFFAYISKQRVGGRLEPILSNKSNESLVCHL